MNNVDYNKIGNLIKDLRKERGLTIEDVSRIIGVTKSAMSQWEKGKGIKIEMLYSLAKYFNISVDELVYAKRKIESNEVFIKRNYDLSLYEFNESKYDEKIGEEYLLHLKQVKTRFISLLKKWVLDEMSNELKEEFDFIKRYFNRDYNYISFSENETKKVLKNYMMKLPLNNELEINWELEKIYNIKEEYLKLNIIFMSKSNYLLEKVLSVLNQPEKDILLARYIKKFESKDKSDINLEEIENDPWLKVMLNNGCNIMKEFNKIPSYIDEEDICHFEGNVYESESTISINDDMTPYIKTNGGNGVVNSLEYWKMYSYKQYNSFIDIKKTEYYKALVNLKNSNPLSYYDALKKYYGGK